MFVTTPNKSIDIRLLLCEIIIDMHSVLYEDFNAYSINFHF